jgi:hypothetical protein
MSAETTTFFYPAMSSFEPDGALVIRASGYDSGSHWSGQHCVATDDPDFALWCSFRTAFRASSPSVPFVSSEQLPAIRAEFLREHPTLGSSRLPAPDNALQT